MRRAKSFLGTFVIWAILGFASYGVICTAYGNGVQAKSQEPGCEVVGKVGNWTVSHCFDGYGHEFIANDAGFIAPLPD